MNNKQIKELAEECGLIEFEENFFEANIDHLKIFAEKIIELYENDIDMVDDINHFTSYGKKEDW